MDPASAVIGIVSFGLTVFKKINDVRKDIKGAPEQLDSLQELGEGVQIILMRLQRAHARVQLSEPEELAYLGRLCAKAHRQLEQLEKFVNKVQRQTRSGVSQRRVKIIAWSMGKDDFEDISKKLKDLRDTLDAMVSLVSL